MTKIILLGGAGIIGKVIARDLALTDDVAEIVVADLNEAGAQATVDKAAPGDSRFKTAAIDVTDQAALVKLLRGADCVINSVQYYFNLDVMRACLEAGCHYLDLGGLFHTTRKQLELNEDFQTKGLTAILGLGSCPGIANVQPALVADRFDAIRSIKIYNGATTDSRDSLAWPYSLATILDEMTEKPVVFRDGQFVEMEPLSEEEAFDFRAPIGHRLAHLTLHSEAATLPLSYAHKGVQECFFKINFFGYSEKAFRRLQGLTQLGLGDKTPVRVKAKLPGGELVEAEVRPRDVLSEVLLRSEATQRGENPGFKDIATVVEGSKNGRPLTIRVDTTAWPHPDFGVSGGTLVVGVPPAVVARWLAAGEVAAKGVCPPETSIDPGRFFKALAERRIHTEITVTEQIV
ncbi:MAG: saccharopine dehydrogenase NADP-binding domain-containing protein [Anaerolineae bacterium]|nr:saccharopine dehydrogenase NADP-binding domain-containing protein [Anaerolineae bacterium]